MGDVLCDGSNARSIECDAYADRCMTTTVTIGPYTSVLKNCSHSKINCEESGVGYRKYCWQLSHFEDILNGFQKLQPFLGCVNIECNNTKDDF